MSTQTSKLFLKVALVILAMTTVLSCKSSKSSVAPEISTDELQPSDTNQIFGGTPVTEGDPLSKAVYQLKFQVAGDDNICTASRISPRTLITAAHCAVTAPIQVYQQGQLIAELSESQIVVHPQYLSRKTELAQTKKWTEGNEFDVALLSLPETSSDDATSTEVTVFELPEHDWIAESDNTQLSAAGFGWASYNAMNGKRSGSNDLKQVAMTSRPSERKQILSFQQAEGKGICVGDSGGPAFLQSKNRLQLYGVAISVQNPGNASVCQGVSSFISVYQLSSWIRQHLQ